MHAARISAWTLIGMLREGNNVGPRLKAAMAILTTSWRANREGEGGSIVTTECGCISAQEQDRRRSGSPSTASVERGAAP